MNLKTLLYLEQLRQPHFCFKLRAIWLISAVENPSFMSLKNRGKIIRSYTEEIGQPKSGKPQTEMGTERKEKSCHIIEINTCWCNTWAWQHIRLLCIRRINRSRFHPPPSRPVYQNLVTGRSYYVQKPASVVWKINPQLYRPGAAWIWRGKTESKIFIMGFSVTSI